MKSELDSTKSALEKITFTKNTKINEMIIECNTAIDKTTIADTKEQYQSKIDVMQEEHSRQIFQLFTQNNSKTTKNSK